MSKFFEGLPTYGTKMPAKGNVKSARETELDDLDRKITGAGGGGHAKSYAIPTAGNKGPEKAEPEVGKGKKGTGKAIGLKGRMESLLKTLKTFSLDAPKNTIDEGAVDWGYMNTAGTDIAKLVTDVVKANAKGDHKAFGSLARALSTEIKVLSKQVDQIMKVANDA